MRTLGGMANLRAIAGREACSITLAACGRAVAKPSATRLSRVRGRLRRTASRGPLTRLAATPLGTLSRQGERVTKSLRRLGERVLAVGEGPVEPVRQRFDVGTLDGRAAPDAQARRRVAVGADVVGDALLLERGREFLTNAACASAESFSDGGIDDLQADAGVGARAPAPWRGSRSRACAPPSRRSPWRWRRQRAISRLEPADRLRPDERVEIILDAQHRRRVDGLAVEDALVELAALGHAEDLRQRPRRRCSSRAAPRRAATGSSMPCAASPPSTFCQEKVTTSSFAPVERLREAGRGGVADGQPLRGRPRSSRRSARARPRSCRSR